MPMKMEKGYISLRKVSLISLVQTVMFIKQEQNLELISPVQLLVTQHIFQYIALGWVGW